MNSRKYRIDMNQVLSEVAQRYGTRKEAIHFMGGFRNRIYEYEKEGQHYIVRISHGGRRTGTMILGEVDWLQYFAAKGLSVVRPVLSVEGNWVEIVENNGQAIPVVVFEKAPGRPPEDEDWNELLFLKMGQFMGKMHQFTKGYAPSNKLNRRPEWREEIDTLAAIYLPQAEMALQKKYWEIRSYLEHLPQEQGAYGLLHLDFHRWNFFVHQGEIILFDFDECQYSWFAADLAMALFYSVSPQIESQKERALAQKFYSFFMKGYSQENKLDSRWLKELPFFINQREVCLYMVLSVHGVDEQNTWGLQFMKGRREKILQNVSYVDIAFEQ